MVRRTSDEANQGRGASLTTERRPGHVGRRSVRIDRNEERDGTAVAVARQSACTILVLPISTGQESRPTTILRVSAPVRVQARASRAPKETRHAAAVAGFPRTEEYIMKRLIAHSRPVPGRAGRLLVHAELGGISLPPAGDRGSIVALGNDPAQRRAHLAPGRREARPPTSVVRSRSSRRSTMPLWRPSRAGAHSPGCRSRHAEVRTGREQRMPPTRMPTSWTNIGKRPPAGPSTRRHWQKAFSDGMAEAPRNIAATAVWVAKNCNL